MFVLQFQFMLKSQQNVDIKLSKICQSHQKLSEWQKVASRFTEIVVKPHENVGVVSSYLFDSLKQGTTGNWILMTQMSAPANSAWVCWLCWLCLCSGHYTVKHNRVLHYLDELYGNELVFAFSFVSSNNTDVETTRQFIQLHTRYVCENIYIVLCLLLRFSCFWPTMNSLMPFKERSFASRLFAYIKG